MVGWSGESGSKLASIPKARVSFALGGLGRLTGIRSGLVSRLREACCLDRQGRKVARPCGK